MGEWEQGGGLQVQSLSQRQEGLLDSTALARGLE